MTDLYMNVNTGFVASKYSALSTDARNEQKF
jgi:hypothetical protein